ncbi:MAG: DNA cytosine methyltransferase [Cyclobacteriaceae bacterium]
MSNKVGIFSFFAGAGFLDLGFERSNYFETLFVNEYHKSFAEIYKSSRNSMPAFGYQVADISENLTNLNCQWMKNNINEARREFDFIGFIGGPPCPDFSVGGKNKGKDGENGRLSAVYIQLICSMQPDFFVFENVKGLYRTKKHREFFNSLKKTLIENDYYLTEKLINALEYGVPQDRERIILIGFRKESLSSMGFRINGSTCLNNFDWNSHVMFNLKTVFESQWPGIDEFEENSMKPSPVNIPVELTVEYWFQKNDVVRHPNAKHYFTPRAGLPKFKTIFEGDDSKKSYKRLHRWRYSPTAAYGNNEVHLHPYKARRITAAEALAIQSLPKDFIIPDEITLTDMFKTIGNGVPFLAAKGIANTINDFMFNNSVIDLDTDINETNSQQSRSVYQSA